MIRPRVVEVNYSIHVKCSRKEQGSRDVLASSLIIIIVCICGGAPSVAAADNNRSIHENIVGCRTWPRFLGTRLLYGSRMTEFATDFYNTDMNIKVIKCADPQALLNAQAAVVGMVW